MRMDVSMKKTKKGNTMTAVMTTLKVYLGDEQIGYGWVYYTDYGMTSPELFRMDGTRMPSGWYHLVPDEDKLVVMTETIQ